ncbi:CAZyme family GH146 [Agaricus bisporus var. burnettii]|uniref:CAZyme family GH146 n=1 Tax=Agaricus bisporus var. burnettii TaxID=192524 RepID=A0A8H7C4M5_AGABI|nr:CAZyme family GH146 [Agaricus bisporus var. burnettii]
MKLLPALQLLFIPGVSFFAQAQTGLAPKKFLPLPLGQVRPRGWLSDQLVVQTNGLAGHEHEFYHYVSQTDWTGGDSLYSNLEEAGSYWFNAMVPNSVLVNETVIHQKTLEFLDYVLDHQDSTGWIGPEVNTNKPRFLWGRYPFFFGAIQLTEVHPELTDRVVTALHKFVPLANKMLHNNGEGVDAWAQTRWEDFVITLQWLHDFHPNGKEDLLVDTMKQLKFTGVPWEKVFSEQLFPKTAVEHTPNPFNLPLTWHGVNIAEGLKALPTTFRFTHNQTDIDTASKGWDMLFQYHGRPSGIYAADEYLAGLEAVRGTELCLVVETMFSGSYLYQVIGDPKFADRVERIAYNALPATITGDMWSRQYLQQQNQIASKDMSPNPFPNDGSYSNVFGLEPNYPCCTVNFPQGWPKFISNAFLKTPDQKSLVHLYLGPFSTSSTLSSDNHVTVNVDTLYPFSDTLHTTITATKAFTYFVRIPSWVSGGTIAINGGKANAVNPSNGLQAVSVSPGTTTFVLNLPAKITIENRPHDSIAIHRGPFNFAFDIPRNQKVLRRDSREPRAVDLEFDASGAWQFAIDPATLHFETTSPSSLPSPIFDSGKSPLSMTVTACPIDWDIAGNTFAAPPPSNPACTGRNTTLTLTPLGTTKLRISEFPVMS